MKWVAAYTEGRIYNSQEDRWKDLPREGVLAVVVGESIYAGRGWYQYQEGQFRVYRVGEKPKGALVYIKRGAPATEQEIEKAVNSLLEGNTKGA